MGEFVSDSKYFIDFGAVNALGRSTGAGSRLLTKVKKVSGKSDSKTETPSAGGVKQAAGFKRKEGGGTLTLTVYRETGPNPEVNWRRLEADRKTFTFTIADEFSGLRESFLCQVSNIDREDDENGTHEDTVVLAFTKRYF